MFVRSFWGVLGGLEFHNSPARNSLNKFLDPEFGGKRGFYHHPSGNKRYHVSNEKNSDYLLQIGDYTTQLYRDYKKPF